MSSSVNNRSGVILLFGDLIAYIFSLVFTLAIRYGEIPSKQLLATHALSFSLLIILFIVVSFSAGLYDKQPTLLRGRSQGLLVRVQIVNTVIGIIFFYFAPVAIAPKANLFIYFVVSTFILLLWRMVMFPVVSSTRRQSAIIVGQGEDVEDLFREVNSNGSYGLVFREHVRPIGGQDKFDKLSRAEIHHDNSSEPVSESLLEETVKRITDAAKRTNSSVIVADFHDRMVESAMPSLYSMVFSGIQIVDASKMYENIFDRIPLSMVGERWLVENSGTSLGNRRIYDSLKRVIDIIFSFVGGIVSLVFYPFVYIAIKIEDKGPIFIKQDRVGKNGKLVRIVKFRSMSGNDEGKYGKNGTTSFTVTRVGKFLRETRIDELPQLWGVLRGELSLVGPRSEFPTLVDVYKENIPYYNARHLVKPGLSGWAQIYHEKHPHHAVDTEDTRDKLSYDLYYIKNRSLALDIKIVLRTLQILMKRAGK